MVLPAFSGRFASSIAAWSAAPEEMPPVTHQPSGGKGVLVGRGNDFIVNSRVQHVRFGNSPFHPFGPLSEHQLRTVSFHQLAAVQMTISFR